MCFTLFDKRLYLNESNFDSINNYQTTHKSLKITFLNKQDNEELVIRLRLEQQRVKQVFLLQNTCGSMYTSENMRN